MSPAATTSPATPGFNHKFSPISADNGFRLPEHWVWCGSPVQAEDGHFHLFASRWLRTLAFHPHWLTNSEIVRATADNILGPYTFQEVVLLPRGANFWDGRMTHNPAIRTWRGKYYLFYTGTTYPAEQPTPEHPEADFSPTVTAAHAGQRVGVAVAEKITGPWKRLDAPLLQPRPGKWDSLMTTNPAPCILQDGTTILIYKSVSRRGDLLRLGVARAPHPEGPYERVLDEPILARDATGDHLEDPFVWQNNNGTFEMIAKDMAGGYCGEPYAGVHATSPDGVHWHISDPPLAYRKEIRFTDTQAVRPAFLERPQLHIQDGQPTTAFFALGFTEKNEIVSHHADLKDSYCVAIPLQNLTQDNTKNT